MLKLREQINASFPKESGTKISVNDFVIKAAAAALKKVCGSKRWQQCIAWRISACSYGMLTTHLPVRPQVPGVNASWQKDFIRQYDRVDVS